MEWLVALLSYCQVYFKFFPHSTYEEAPGEELEGETQPLGGFGSSE